MKIPIPGKSVLTHWGWVTYICVSDLTIIGSDNGLSPGRCHAIIWTYAGILLIGPLQGNFNEIVFEIWKFSLKKCTWKCRLRNGSRLSRPQCVDIETGPYWHLLIPACTWTPGMPHSSRGILQMWAHSRPPSWCNTGCSTCSPGRSRTTLAQSCSLCGPYVAITPTPAHPYQPTEMEMKIGSSGVHMWPR